MLLVEHVIRFDLWREFTEAMQQVGLYNNPVYQHVAAVGYQHTIRKGKRKAEEDLSNPDERHRGDVESMDDE